MNKSPKKVPELRFKGFSDDWEQRKIIDIGEVVTGSTPSTSNSDYYDGEYLFVSPADIQENRYIVQTNTTLTKSGFDISRKIRGGSILFVSIGSTIGKVGQASIELTTNQQINSVIPSKNFDDNFVYSTIVNVSNKIKQLTATQAVPIINKSVFSKFQITVSLIKDEQEKIGTFFANLDYIITLHQRKLDALMRLKEAYLQNMFPGKGESVPRLRFTNFEGDWEQCKLGELTERVRGNDERMNLPTLTISASRGWLNQLDRFSGNIAGKEQKNYTLLKKGQLSYNRGNSKVAKFGVVYELKSYEEALVPRIYHSFQPIKGVSSTFLEYKFSTNIPDRELAKLITSGARMDGLLNISYDDFMSINIFVPKYEEQKKMKSYLIQLDKAINLHQQKLKQLQKLKKAYLQKMFL